MAQDSGTPKLRDYTVRFFSPENAGVLHTEHFEAHTHVVSKGRIVFKTNDEIVAEVYSGRCDFWYRNSD